MSQNPTEIVQSYFEAMKAGPDAAEALFALFADDAVYVEPFSGTEQTYEGRPAIEACLRGGWGHTPRDLELTVSRIDVDGDVVRSEWVCTSCALRERDDPLRRRVVALSSDGGPARLSMARTDRSAGAV